GEMLVLIGAADICFMGGSLIGDKVGGHNVLEPAALGVPVITGPSYYNFQDLVAKMLHKKVIKLIESPNEMSLEVEAMFQDALAKRVVQENLLSFVKDNVGALTKTIRCIESIK
ncbi:3-deoxy-D-manno-octulosonic acid transferase, partial [Vibrio parahaemolyticus]|nr:3-deoxy-D-manno-octulosonic acid transferase [Vibrio parahaemolyticus]